MSAFNVHPEHLKELAIYAGGSLLIYGTDSGYPRIRKDRLREMAREHGLNFPESETLENIVAEILRAENARSVAYLYDEAPDTTPIFVEKREQKVGAVAILKMLDCLEYQSCECPDWRNTVAYRIISTLRQTAISELPGYEEAPWEYTG